VVLALAAALAWFVWLPHYRPSLHAGEQYGIDVSEHQGTIDWPKVAHDHIGFAYIKATEGRDFTDSRFVANWTNAAAAGVDRGAYHFFTLCSPGADQARHFLDVVRDQEGALTPAVDLELKGNCSSRPGPSALYAELNSFLDVVETATHRQVVLYVGDEFEDRYPVRSGYRRPLWVRHLLRRPGGDWTIWQVHGNADVDGIDGHVDLDVRRPSA